MDKLLSYTLAFLLALATSSCGNKNATVESHYDTVGKIDYLKTRCNGETDHLANILNLTSSQLDSITAGQLIITKDVESRINDVFSYASSHNVSLNKIRAKYDTSLKWYDKIHYLPATHPGVFWIITALLLLFFILNRIDDVVDEVVTSPYTITGFGHFLSRLFFWLKNVFLIEVGVYLIAAILHYLL